MKFVVNQLHKGDIVSAEIVEMVSAKEYIVSFAGDLVRVVNASERLMQSGESIHLKVTSVKPLGFQLLHARPNKYAVTI